MTPDAVRNPLTERFLDDRGLKWELKTIPLADIDIDKSHHNQARIETVDPDLVERYRQHDEVGAVFPAIIVGRNGRGSKYVIGDGIHRVEAKLKNKRQMVWAYTFTYEDDAEFRSVSRTANAILNGRDNSEPERLMHAAAFVDQGVDRKTAAYQCGVTPNRLATYIRAVEARQRFADLGIGAGMYKSLSDNALVDVAGAAADGAVRRALEMVKAGVPSKQVLKALKEAKTAGHTETKRSEAQIAALLDLLESRTGGDARQLTRLKRDTMRMRLLGAFKVVNEIRESGRADEFADDLAKLRDLCS